MTTLGIIKADDVDVDLRCQFGDTLGMFERLFESTGFERLELRSYDAQEYRYPQDLDECDGYLITGSRFCAFSDTPWIQRMIEFIQMLDRERKKLIGICFGHQCIALALGGTVINAPQGWGMGVQEYRLLLPEELPEVATPTIRLRCSHEDQVERLPSRAKRLLTNEFCENAGMVVEEHILSLQAHPEFGEDFTRHLIENREQELGPNFESVLASLDNEVDGIPVARSVVRFLESS